MDIDEISNRIEALDGVLVLRPGPGDGSPEISWGDRFFYYAPDGVVPTSQPFATIVTKDYPDDTLSELDREGRWRVNIHVGRERFRELTGQEPRAVTWSDFATADVFMPHPVYGALGWASVVNPGDRTMTQVEALLQSAHEDARARDARRSETGSTGRSGE